LITAFLALSASHRKVSKIMPHPLLIGLMLITALHAFDELVLVIAMPAIASQLGGGDLYGLSIASYILASLVGMCWAGKRIDQKGPAYVLRLGLTLFTLGIVLAIVSWSPTSFIVARILQGIGGGIGWTTTFALVNLVFVGNERARTISTLDIAWVVPSLLAPPIGGYFVDYMSWRWIFVVQLVPVILVALLVFPRIAHLTKFTNERSDPSMVWQALRISLGTAALLYLVSQPPSWLWLLTVPAILIALPAFNRMMPAQWWRGATSLSLPIATAIISFTAFYGLQTYQPLFLVDQLHFRTTDVGLLLTAACITWMAGSYLSSRLYPTLSRLQSMQLGSVLLILGIVIIAISTAPQVSAIAPFIPVNLTTYLSPLYGGYLAWAFAGLGLGFIFNAARTAAMENTPKTKRASLLRQ
jgi:Arabinose efflux permease